MSADEACVVILVLEEEKAKYLKRYRNTETGSRVTKIAFDGTAEVLDATAKGLKVNPLTSIAGFIVSGVERNVAVAGEIISNGISETGKSSNLPLIEDLEKQINLLESLVKDANSFSIEK